MGSLISRFRAKKTPLEVLEGLEEEIETLEHDRQTTMIKQKKYIWRLIFYSLFLYLIFALSVYYVFFPSTLRDGAVYIAPLVLIPIMILIAQKILNWYFTREMYRSKEKLADLRAKKKKILDEVMDKETFRVAKEILEKFAPDQLRKNMPGLSEKAAAILDKKITPPKKPESGGIVENKKENAPVTRVDPQFSPDTGNTVVVQRQQLPTPHMARMSPPPYVPLMSDSTSIITSTPTSKRRLVRPILPPSTSRGFLDRVIESLVGDGPSNRYALICANCSLHNGMALKEEFEYMSFRCAYCGFPNPARKVKLRKALTDESNSAPVASIEDSKSSEFEGRWSKNSGESSSQIGWRKFTQDYWKDEDSSLPSRRGSTKGKGTQLRITELTDNSSLGEYKGVRRRNHRSKQGRDLRCESETDSDLWKSKNDNLEYKSNNILSNPKKMCSVCGSVCIKFREDSLYSCFYCLAKSGTLVQRT